MMNANSFTMGAESTSVSLLIPLPSFFSPLRNLDKQQTPVASISWAIAALLM